ncbi:MAG: reprolysin-like metallopeptidase, partial [Thermoanaerobaculia bacterium]
MTSHRENARARSSDIRMSCLTAASAFAFFVSFSASLAGEVAPPRQGVSADGLWRTVVTRPITRRDESRTVRFPESAEIVALDVPAMLDRLRAAPLESTTDAESHAVVITLPMPDGAFSRFAVQESPMIDDAMAASMPEVRTYLAQGIDDRAASARLDFTAFGFHGFVIGPAGSVYIDPISDDDRVHYASYWRRDFRVDEDLVPFKCSLTGRGKASASKAARRIEATVPAEVTPATGPVLRTYRLALAATGEYSKAHGGTSTTARATMITTVNRINAIFESELAIRLMMVDNRSIIFADAATDPYTNRLDDDIYVNSEVLDSRVGSANYDVGHLLVTDVGGLAFQPTVCNSFLKAEGVSGLGSADGHPLYVEIVGHELGHQLGAGHTFNSGVSFCRSERWWSEAFEPGSGSTIMSYAGICREENLQLLSDPYFHSTSFESIYWETSIYSSCAQLSNTNNSTPVVSVPQSVTIPASTPFYLSGSATDADGDALTYCWEQFDLGNPSPPLTDDGSRPIFRSFPAVTSPTRTFPRLEDILAGTTTRGESLPTTTRTINFRLTVRDNRAG